MDDGILIPRGDLNLIPENITASSARMLKIQEEIMSITATILKKSDDIHNATQKPDAS